MQILLHDLVEFRRILVGKISRINYVKYIIIMYADPLSAITFFRSYAETVKEKVQRIEERYNPLTLIT